MVGCMSSMYRALILMPSTAKRGGVARGKEGEGTEEGEGEEGGRGGEGGEKK